MPLPKSPPFLESVRLIPGLVSDYASFPFSLGFVRGLDLTFSSAVTFLVGENGSGKSTLIEALAAFCRLPLAGGGSEDLADNRGPDDTSDLSHVIRPRFVRRPKRGYFFRAELQAQFASLLEKRK